MRGADVLEVQQRLALLGYPVGALDGTYGERTASAVCAFQRDRGLDAHGVVGLRTHAWLADPPGRQAPRSMSSIR